MTETEPRPVGDVPPERSTEENPQGVEPDTEEKIREREGERDAGEDSDGAAGESAADR